mmetsp:Transcript_33853/g.95839  ORF Transcript_33853/g.95839 Transcript_33853/m.95839 type:complete len:256 (-) Transcript_33853:559-1326(-)
MTMRVVGFDYANCDSADGKKQRPPCGRRLACPVSPLGPLLQRASFEEQSRGGDSIYTDSDEYGNGYNESEDYDMYDNSHSWEAYGYEAFPNEDSNQYSSEEAFCPPPPPPSKPSFGFTQAQPVTECTCSTFSDPIPIPSPKPKSPKVKPDEPKNIRRVPEPPMLRAVTAPAVVEEVYAEYERVKKQAIEDQMYRQMVAAQGGATNRRLLIDTRIRPSTGMGLGTEMDKLSWRTVYTQLQSDALPVWGAVTSAAMY